MLTGKRTYIAAAIVAFAGVINAIIGFLVQIGKLSQETADALVNLLNSIYVIFVGGGLAALRSAVNRKGEE